jgi:hypothetical protein
MVDPSSSFPRSRAGRRGALRGLLAFLTATLVFASLAAAEGGRTLHISPTGCDQQDGSTPERAWRTFDHALPQLRPGDTLVLASGTYTPTTSGLLTVDCTRKGGARHGEPSRPIRVTAAAERQALIASDGSRSPVSVLDCSYWILEGIAARSADLEPARGGAVFRVRRSHHLMLRRLLAHWPNRFRNAPGIAIGSSHHVTVEESEVYAYHRHGISVYKSHDVQIRRCYVNSRGQLDHPRGYESDRPGGDESFVLYHSSDSIIENSIAEFETRGFEIHGGTTFDGRPGGYRNRVLGSIHFTGHTREHFGAGVDTRMGEGTDFVVRPAWDNLFRDFLVIDASGAGAVLRSAVGVRMENVTLYHGAGAGIRAMERSRRFLASKGKRQVCGKPIDQPFFDGMDRSIFPGDVFACSFRLENSLVWGQQGPALTVGDGWDWTVEHSNLFGNGGGDFPHREPIADGAGHIRFSTSVEPTGMGPEGRRTLVFVPDGSNLRGAGADGADVGANILCRLENGEPTHEPLWDPETGAFPCGAQLAGVNDVPRSCATVHQLLHVSKATLGDALTRCDPPGSGRPGSGAKPPQQGAAASQELRPEAD